MLSDREGPLKAALKHHRSGDLRQAAHIYMEMLLAQPDDADVLHLLGVVYSQAGNYKAAAENIRKALQISPDFAEAYINLGNAVQFMGQPDEAIACYREAIRLSPDLAEAYYNLGNVFRDKQQPDKAITCYQKAIQLSPGIAEPYYNLGIAFKGKKQYEKAAQFLRKALEIVPDSASVANDLGLVLAESGLVDEAIGYYRKAIELLPSFAGAYYNLGNAFKEKEQFTEALGCYRKAVGLYPGYSYAHWNMSLVLLLFGDLTEGWKEYEWRWELKDIYPRRDFAQPVWDGSAADGRTVLLHAEQGFGDAIQFIRYAPLVAKRGARVIVECQKELVSLFKGVEGVGQIIGQGGKLPEFDTHCPFLTLPFALGTTSDTVPDVIPYINPDPGLVEEWRNRTGADASGLKIGLVWSGNPRNANDRNRSLPLSMFSGLAKFSGVALYSLQMGEAAGQAGGLSEGLKPIDHTKYIHDFSDTAAFISNLDLVISVDTAVAHLAGALGKPVWILLPTAPDWRWQLNRIDSPWYPSMRLFRQSAPGEWQDVIIRIAEELDSLISGRRDRS